VWICSPCRLPVTKNHHFGQILTCRGLLYWPPFTDEGQIWCVKADQRSTLTYQISSECVHCVGFQWPKHQNFGQILTFRGLLYRHPFTDEDQIWCATADPWCTLTYQISSRSVYSVALCWRKPPIFAVFYGLRHLVLSPIGNKVEHGCTTTNLSLSNGIKIVSVLQRLHGKIGCTISDVQKRDEQTKSVRMNWMGKLTSELFAASSLYQFEQAFINTTASKIRNKRTELKMNLCCPEHDSSKSMAKTCRLETTKHIQHSEIHPLLIENHYKNH